jgi:hypothetical protein
VRGRTCEQGFKEFGPLLAPQLANVKIATAKVNGDHATVTLSTSQRRASYTLTKSGGSWKISQI